MKHISHTPDASGQPGPTVSDRRDLIAHHMAALEDLLDPEGSSEGWTPTARKGFLRLVAEHGRVADACQCVGLSRQSAYSLRARDPLFAIGWDAACHLARMPLADRLYEQVTDGLTDTITREDGRTITRHRFDSRLSIAVLNRLDRRCDKAAEQGSSHLGAIASWDAFVDAIGDDDPAAAQAIIDAHAAARLADADSTQLRQPCQPDPDTEDTAEDDIPDPRIWWDLGHKAYRTNFPPPAGSDCFQHEQFGHPDYHRDLTDEEAALIAASDQAEASKRRIADEAERDAYFAGLREKEVPPPSAAPTPPPGTGGGAGDTSPSPSSGGGGAKRRRGDSVRKGNDARNANPPPPGVKSSPDP